MLIQGPIISIGRNFSTSSDINFDSSRYIESLYYSATQNKAVCILATWDSEPTSTLNIPNKDIHQFTDNKRKLTKNILNNRLSSKYKQFFLVMKGLEILQQRGCDFIIKIRTDQLLNLESLIAFVSQNSNYPNSKILTLFGNPDTPDSWVDFAFAGDLIILKNSVGKYLSQKEMFSSVHRDFFYHAKRQELSGIALLMFKFKLPYRENVFSKKQMQLIIEIWKSNFDLLPRDILQDFEWRGAKFPGNLINKYFGYEENSYFIELLEKKKAAAPKFALSWFSTDFITIFFPGSFSDKINRIRNSIKRRTHMTTRSHRGGQ